jgi:peptidoglycan/LPS O-acetylase OafA/YrhL
MVVFSGRFSIKFRYLPMITERPNMTEKTNNFDLIRFFAASQVVVMHSLEHLGIMHTREHPIGQILYFLPGVPIFFFVSGFLISASFERTTTTIEFFRNRLLRIYPGLWTCLFVALLSVYVVGYFETVQVSVKSFVVWVFAQLSIGQFYSPDFMRGFGVGVLNGSLWTISVELQFYLAMPVVFMIFRQSRALFWGVFLAFIGINLFYTLTLAPRYSERIETKLFSVTFAPWIAPFLVGFLFNAYRDKLKPFYEGKALHWALAYVVLVVFGLWFQSFTDTIISGNRITPLHYVPISFLVLAFAYSNRGASERILGSNDISYGVYIFHMPIINMWLYLELGATYLGMVAVCVLTLVCAWLSWKLIERPALRMKRATIFKR